MEDELPDVAYPVEGRLAWWRGPSKIQGEYLVLDKAHVEEYWLDTQAGPGNDLAFAFAKLGSREANLGDLVDFAADWGLLTVGPDSGLTTERTADILAEAQRVHAVLTMYSDLLGFVQSGSDHEPLTKWAAVLEGSGIDSDPEPLLLADLAAGLVNDALGSTPLALAVDPSFGDVGVAPFHASIGATDLRGLVYFHVATLLMDNIPVATCPECGRAFGVNHSRQRFCSERCGTRARQRRFIEARRHK